MLDKIKYKKGDSALKKTKYSAISLIEFVYIGPIRRIAWLNSD